MAPREPGKRGRKWNGLPHMASGCFVSRNGQQWGHPSLRRDRPVPSGLACPGVQLGRARELVRAVSPTPLPKLTRIADIHKNRILRSASPPRRSPSRTQPILRHHIHHSNNSSHHHRRINHNLTTRKLRTRKILHRHPLFPLCRDIHIRGRSSALCARMPAVYWMNIARRASSFYFRTCPSAQKVRSIVQILLNSLYCFRLSRIAHSLCPFCRDLPPPTTPHERWRVSTSCSRPADC